jgi:hypothetical protein
MLRLLAWLLPKRKMPAVMKTAGQRGNVSLIGAPKETAISREIMPADGSSSGLRIDEDFDTSSHAVGQAGLSASLSLADRRGKA